MAQMPQRKDQSNRLIWVDIETTGLSATHELPLEIGLMLTDLAGNEISEFHSLVLDGMWASKLMNADPEVQDMHDASGLWQDLQNANASRIDEAYSACQIHNIDKRIVAWLENEGMEPGVHPLVGSTINFDRNFLERYFPDTAEFFHYRNIDVSTLRGLCEKLNPELWTKFDGKKGNHRVLQDIRASVRLYQFFENEFLHTTR